MRFSSALIRRASCKSGNSVQKRCMEMRGQVCKRNNGLWGDFAGPKIGRISWYAKAPLAFGAGIDSRPLFLARLGSAAAPYFFVIRACIDYFLLEKKVLDGFNQDEQASAQRTAPAWNAGPGRNWLQAAKQPNSPPITI